MAVYFCCDMMCTHSDSPSGSAVQYSLCTLVLYRSGEPCARLASGEVWRVNLFWPIRAKQYNLHEPHRPTSTKMTQKWPSWLFFKCWSPSMCWWPALSRGVFQCMQIRPFWSRRSKRRLSHQTTKKEQCRCCTAFQINTLYPYSY